MMHGMAGSLKNMDLNKKKNQNLTVRRTEGKGGGEGRGSEKVCGDGKLELLLYTSYAIRNNRSPPVEGI